jgi:hypothetical protein
MSRVKSIREKLASKGFFADRQEVLIPFSLEPAIMKR